MSQQITVQLTSLVSILWCNNHDHIWQPC